MKLLFSIVLVTAALVSSSATFAQSDTLVDVFPLAVGNQWTYRYFTIFQQNGSPGILTITDSGRAIYSIVSVIRAADSTRWIFRVRRDLIHHRSIPDSTYPVRDSSSFELVERHEAQHHLYRNQDPNPIHLDVFPFTREFTDTTRIYRYRKVGLGDTTTFRSAIPRGFPNPLFRSTFTYKKSEGQTRFRYNSGTLDLYDAAEHFLLSSVITSADKTVEPTHPADFILYQNYPNHFNPTTEIRYQISEVSHVTLNVFDLMGRKVATLVNEVKAQGEYEVQFDASNLSSGVYLYKLCTERHAIIRKMLLIR